MTNQNTANEDISQSKESIMFKNSLSVKGCQFYRKRRYLENENTYQKHINWRQFKTLDKKRLDQN